MSYIIFFYVKYGFPAFASIVAALAKKIMQLLDETMQE